KIDSVQRAVEALETAEQSFDLLVCDYTGPSTALLKCLLTVKSELPCVLFTPETGEPSDEIFLTLREGVLVTIRRGAGAASALQALLDRLRDEGFFESTQTPDTKFVRIRTQGLVLAQPLEADIYLRLGANRYCMRFKA